MDAKILIIEDEQALADLVAYHLRQEKFEVTSLADGMLGFQQIIRAWPTLVVLDVMLPGMNGLEICRRVRAHPEGRRTAILLLTAKGEEIDRVMGFESGADDYLVKPFSPRELVLRVRAILKRTSVFNEKSDTTGFLVHKELQLDSEKHRVVFNNHEIVLTITEFKLLEFLLRNIGRVLTRDVLLDKVWGYGAEITTRTVDAHVKRLREKVGAWGDAIETVRGVGYRLRD